MTDQPQPSPAAAAPPPKRVSGILMMSLIASFGLQLMSLMSPSAPLRFFTWLGIPPLIGLVLAIIGYRTVKRDRNLIGPKLAIVCMILAGIMAGFQGYARYQNYPRYLVAKACQSVGFEFFDALKTRDHRRLHAALSESYRAAHGVDDVRATVEAGFPGSDPIQIENNLKPRKDHLEQSELEARWRRLIVALVTAQALPLSAAAEMEARWNRLFEGESGEATVPNLFLLDHAGGEVRLDVMLHVTREGRKSAAAEIVDFTATWGPKAAEPGPGAGTGAAAAGTVEPAVGTGPPATGTGDAAGGAGEPGGK